MKNRRQHANLRLLERYEGDITVKELEQKIKRGQAEYLKRLSCSRSLTRMPGNNETWIYVILNRKEQSIITVLTEEQAIDLMRWTDEDRDVVNF